MARKSTDEGSKQSLLKELPAVQDLLREPAVADFVGRVPRALVVAAVQEEIDRARKAILASKEPGDIRARIAKRLAREVKAGPQRVLNATGVIVHTNLGRAPLAPAAIDHVREVAAGYSTLEYDLDEGKRGSRQVHVERLLVEALGCEAALAVNNNAAAVMLVLAAIAQGKAGAEVVVSRGELVEIGGSFRVPDILRASGAKLVEVGTTNRTHLKDYEKAIGPETAAILKVHTSNFRVVGFTAEATEADLAPLAKKAGVPLICDIGSGMLVDFGIDEPAPARVLKHADLVTFSGDKLLGGPQAGIVAGKKALVEAAKKHPLARALRVDKLSLAALATTLRLALDPSRVDEIPVARMVREPVAVTKARAEKVRAALAERAGADGIAVVPSEAAYGGGSVPGQTLASAAIRIDPSRGAPAALEAALRSGPTPVISRVHDEALLLDLRTVADSEVDLLVEMTVRVLATRKVGNVELQ